MDREELAEIIEKYFYHGYSYKYILCLLSSKHNYTISLRTLKRILQKEGMKKKGGGLSCSDNTLQELVEVQALYRMIIMIQNKCYYRSS